MCIVWTSSTTFGASPRRAAASNASSATRSSGIRRERPERLLRPGRARDRAARRLEAVVHDAGRVLEGLAFEQAGEQEVALLEAHQLLVEIDVLPPRQEPARLQLDERRRDQEELGRDVEIDMLHPLDLGAEDVDDPGQRDLPEVDLLPQDEVQQEVERALENRCRNLVRHARQITRGESQACGTAWAPAQTPGSSRGRPVTCPPMARVFSGIQPSGEMHLGNYLGAVRRWVDSQPAPGSEAARDHHAIFCVVDLHAMTLPWNPAELTESTRRLATLLAAAGLDEARSLLFVQSHVRAHAELTWILNCVATYGELKRMTQFKDKSAKQGEAGTESASVGLFDYPVLMVSDILLYETAEVPVGDDQRQHVELARDVAIRFNSRFGETFVVPKATFPTVGARVMDLQRPDRKMSKSEDSPQGTILVLDPPKTIEKKIKSAVTDSGSEVRHDRGAKPGVSNLIEIYGAVTGRGIADVEKEFDGKQYGVFKVTVAEAVVEFLRPVQERYAALGADPAEMDRRLGRGADAAEAIAEPVLAPRGGGGRSAPPPVRLTRSAARARLLPGRRMREVGRAVVLAQDPAEVAARPQEEARRPAAVRALDDDRLRAAPVDVDAHTDAGGREVRLAHARVRLRRPGTGPRRTAGPLRGRGRR